MLRKDFKHGFAQEAWGACQGRGARSHDSPRKGPQHDRVFRSGDEDNEHLAWCL